MHVVYLHGFASSPASTKAAFFAERLRSHGIEVRCPDLVVDPDMVRRFASDRPAVSLRMLDDDHQLGGSLGRLWTEVAAFMGVCS